jgi:2-oxoisovalerate dehydrogenase E1 component
MGGRRGYGPTHSQTLDKFLLGIDNVRVLAINTLDDPAIIYETIVEKEIHPVIVFENKADYNKKIGHNIPLGFINQSNGKDYPTYRIIPDKKKPNLTLVAYGGMVDVALGSLITLFKELEVFAEIVVPTSLCPLDLEPILTSVQKTGRLVTLEEGSGYSGFGGEIIAQVCEIADFNFIAKRIAALPVPIPSAKSLEMEVLPTSDKIIETVRSLFR